MSAGQTVILNSDKARAVVRRMADTAPPGSVVNIREATRTSEQNDKMWAQLSDVSRAKPEGRSHKTHQWKAIFMAACGHKPSFLPGLEDGEWICEGYKSSRLTKAEFSDLITCIQAYGDEHGVQWTDERAAA